MVDRAAGLGIARTKLSLEVPSLARSRPRGRAPVFSSPSIWGCAKPSAACAHRAWQGQRSASSWSRTSPAKAPPSSILCARSARRRHDRPCLRDLQLRHLPADRDEPRAEGTPCWRSPPGGRAPNRRAPRPLRAGQYAAVRSFLEDPEAWSRPAPRPALESRDAAETVRSHSQIACDAVVGHQVAARPSSTTRPVSST